MNRMVKWSDSAKTDYWDNIDYLIDNWSENVAINFIEKVDGIIDIIVRSPKTFQKSRYRNTHFVVIVPQITLYYRVSNDKEVELIRFFNNFKSPERLKLE